MLQIILLLNPIYISLFWAIELSFNKKESNYPKVFLGKFMTVAFLLYVCYFIYYYEPLHYYYYYVDPFLQLFLLSLFPLYYIYVRLLTVDKKITFKKHFKYLIAPLIVFFMYLIGCLSVTHEEHQMFVYGNITQKPTGSLLFFSLLYEFSRIFYLLHSSSYSLLSFIQVTRHRKSLENYYANTDEDSLEKIYKANIIISITSLLYIVFSFIDKSVFLEGNNFMVLSLLITGMFFLIGWLGNKQRPVLIEEDQSIKNISSEVTNKQLEQIQKKIMHLFNNEKVYLNKDLTLWELSRLVGTNRTYVSLVINQFYNQNFSTFVNSYRAAHVQELIQLNPELTNADLAGLSGFGSVISMQRAFQTFVGKTITQVKTEVEGKKSN